MVLPVNVDTSYPDHSPGDKAHQQHHDVIHAAINGLGDAAVLDVGATPGTVAAGDDSRIVAGGSSVQPGDLGDSASLDVGVIAGTVAAGDDSRIVAGETATQPGDLGGSALLDIGVIAGTVAAGDDSRVVAGGTAIQLADLGDAASLDVGAIAGTVAAGDDSRIVAAIQPGDLGTAAIHAAEDFEVAGAAAALRSVPRWAPNTGYALNQQVVDSNNDVVSANVAHTSSAAYATDSAKWVHSSTYGRRRQPTLVVIGDSIVGKGDGPGSPGTAVVNKSYHPDGYWTHALNLLGGRLRFLSNLGIGGTDSTQVLATVPAALALSPGYVLENCGVNDVVQNLTAIAIQANKTAIWDAIEAGGARPIASTITPFASYTGGQKAILETVNIWIREQARIRNDLILVDSYAAIAAPIGGISQSVLVSDGTHPNALGAFLIGKLMAAALSPLLPPNLELCSSEGDSANLIAAGSRFATGGAGAVNTGTNYSDHMTSTTYTKEPRTDGVNGSWQVFTVATGANTGGFVQFNIPISAAMAVGDSVIAAVEYDLSNLDPAATATKQGFGLRVQSYNGSAATDLIFDQYWIAGANNNLSARSRAGVLRTPPVVIPAGTTILLVILNLFGGGTFKLDRTTVLNVTQRALVGN